MKGKKGTLFSIALFLVIICAIVSSLIIINPEDFTSFILLVIAGVSSITIIIQLLFYLKNNHRYILEMNKGIIKTQKESLYYFPAPAIIMDEKNYIVWYNRFFEERVFSHKETYGKKLNEIIEIDVNKIYTKSGTVIKHDGRYYRVLASHCDNNNHNSLSMVYFEDISQFKALESEHYNSHPVVIILMIDNYDELLQDVKDSSKTQALIRLEKLLEGFMENTTGIIRRIANDKYFIIIEERHLKEIILKRFDILDKAREIMINDRFGLTLSIGVGRGGETISESEAFAKQALDMCLGRGGDQCAVKTTGGFEFFGGVSKGIEKQTKVKTRIIATALAELVDANDRIFVMGHKFGDLDSIGAAIGLCGAVRKMGKVSHVVVDPNKNLAKKLIKYISNSDSPDMFIKPEEALLQVNEKTLLIIVDTHNPDFVDSKELYEKVPHIVVIDHHRKMVNFISHAVIFHHEPYASSASEMVAELIQYFGERCKISAPQAEALLAGIMLDTKNFVMRTGVRTFEAAAFLRKLGADTVAVRHLFSSSIETYQQKSRLVADAEIYNNCAIAISDVKTEEMRMAAPQAADELLGISGVSASFVIFDINGTINISARSLGGFNVQVVLEKLGGGGHQTMAGVQLEGYSIEDAKQSLLEVIDEYILNSSKS